MIDLAVGATSVFFMDFFLGWRLLLQRACDVLVSLSEQIFCYWSALELFSKGSSPFWMFYIGIFHASKFYIQGLHVSPTSIILVNYGRL